MKNLALADLTELEILQGSLGLLWVIIASLIGFKIIYKAINLKRKELIFVGLAYILVVSAWWGVAFQFVSYGLLDIKLDEYTYIFIANAFIPIALICWGYAICEIMNPELKKNLFVFIFIFSVVWEIYIIYFLFSDISMIARLESTFDSNQSTYNLIFIVTAILIFVITGMIFSLKSMKLEDKELKWKGRFLFIAWISFFIGALMDSAITLNAVNLVIVRLILISGAIEYYLGFFLPKPVANQLVK